MRVLLGLLLGLFCLQAALSGQRVIYNQSLDKQRQDAAAAAKRISSATATAKELQNLAAIEKDQIDGALASALVTMRREIEALSTWGSVSRLAGRMHEAADDPILGSGPLDDAAIDARQKAIDAEKKDLESRLAALKKSSKEQPFSLDPAVERLGDVNDLLEFSGSVANVKENKEASKALKEVQDGLKEINELIGAAHTIWDSERKVEVNPRTLAPSAEDTQLALLSVEVQYLKELVLIRARRMLDYGELRKTIDALQDEIANAGVVQDKQIAADLAELTAAGKAAAARGDADDYEKARRGLRARLRILHLAGSVSAQNTAARDVAGLRETLAWRRSKLRIDAVYNGTYEKTIATASARLAAYYGSGVKPAQIAQVLSDLVVAASLPNIAF